MTAYIFGAFFNFVISVYITARTDGKMKAEGWDRKRIEAVYQTDTKLLFILFPSVLGFCHIFLTFYFLLCFLSIVEVRKT